MTDTTTETPTPPASFDIPWKLVAVSPDMMDTTYCNKKFPLTWRSSLIARRSTTSQRYRPGAEQAIVARNRLLGRTEE